MQRGWKSCKSSNAEGQRIYYNFVKPHQVLEGVTPAAKVGIKIEGKDRLKSLPDSAFS